MNRIQGNLLSLFLLFGLALPVTAGATSASLVAQAQAANPVRYQFAVNKAAEIRSTSDNKAFTIWWQPTSAPPAGVLVALHGHGSYATDEFFLWQPYLEKRGYAMLALQWWFGGGETTADYYQPSEMYPLIASLLSSKGVKPGTVLFHGYSRGSANSYAVAALDTFSGNRFFAMTLSNSGGAATDFPPNQQIAAGAFGAKPFAGMQWMMYCGEKDPDPTLSGCQGMAAARDWVTQYGATIKLFIDDPNGGHGGFMTNASNVNIALAAFALTELEVQTYVPAAAAPAGYVSYLRVINTGTAATQVTVAKIDPATGSTGAAGTLNASLPAGAAVTYTATQVETALGSAIAAAERPRIRLSASSTIEAQSLLLQPGGVFNEVSGVQSGSAVAVNTYVPAAAAASGYVSSLRVINTGGAPTAVTVAKIDPVTGLTGTAGTLNASLPAGAAVTYTAAQVETALGTPIAAAERPRILVTGAASVLDVQSFMTQPGGAYTNVSGEQSGTVIDVRSYVPLATPGYTSFLRVINAGSTASPVSATLLDDVTGLALASGTLVASLPGNAASTFSSAQVEAALGTTIAASSRPRIRVSSPSGTVSLRTQSLLLQPGGAFNEISGALSGSSVVVRTYVPAADAATGYTSYLRVINPTASATPVSIALVDSATGAVGAARTLIASLPGGAAQTLGSIQIEAALGVAIAAGARPRIQISGAVTLDVQSFLTQPGGAFTDVSGGVSNAPTGVAVGNVNTQTVGGNSFSSSTRLMVTWTRPAGYTVDHYLVSASEAAGGTSVSATATAAESAATLSGLKSGTTYSVVVTACKDSGCSQAASATAATGSTAQEYWQLQGTGATVAGLTKVVSDGNVRIAVIRYGTDAPDTVKNRMQLYYGPSSLGSASGLATALSAAVANPAVPSSYFSFVSAAGTFGLQNPTTAATLVKLVNAGQALPLTSAAGGYVRIYFEGQGSDNKTRILSINSKDGYTGKDFNGGSSTICQTTADYSTGGGCEPTVVIPVEGDLNGNSKIANARQFKIGFPMQDDWRWDEAVGTWMLFTVDTISGCTTSNYNQAYAVWNGSKWVVQYETNGCPKLMKSMQAATPVHLGGVRYKIYYGDPSDTTGRVAGSPLPFLGPKKVLYADGTSTSSAGTVEFEDWEATSNGRGVNFLWPNGSLLNSTAEGYIDDFMAVAPTGSLDSQVLYVAITDGVIPPFSAGALLLNP